MSELKLTADSGGGTVSIKGPSTTGSNGNREFLLPDTYSGNGSLVTADSNGDILLADSDKLKLGTGSDLSLYHDGTNSYLSNSTGNTYLRAGGGILYLRAVDNENGVKIHPNAAVEVYYNDSKKFETSSTGGIFRGTLWTAIDNTKIAFGTGDDLQIYHDGSNSYVDNHQGDLYIRGEDDNIILQAIDGENSIKCNPNGSVHLYYDNVDKFSTTSTGATVNGANLNVINTANAGDARLYLKAGEGGTAYLLFNADEGDNEADNWKMVVPNSGPFTLEYDEGNWEKSIECNRAGNVELYYDNDKKCDTYSEGFRVYGDLIPNNDDARNLGKSGYRWDEVWAANGSIQTSDRNEKNTITESDLGLDFINKLKPISYKWNKDEDTTHYGLIAQDLEEVLNSINKPISDFGGLKKPENAPMGLNYSQLISPLIKAVQELSAKVEALEAG